MRRPGLLLFAALAWTSAAAAEKACFYGYAGFEETVRHLDLDICPGRPLKPEEGFCRISLSGDDVLIYEFHHVDGEPCLARIDRYAFNDFVERFGLNYTKP